MALWALPVAYCLSLSGQQRLVSNHPLAFDLSKSAPAAFSVSLEAGTVAHIRVDQLDGDVAVAVFDPAGARRNIDGFDFGRESITILGASTGEYRLDLVRAPRVSGKVSGRVLLESVTRVGSGDEQRTRAEELATISKLSLHDGTQATRALEVTALSLAAWEGLQDAFAVARTHLRLGDIYFTNNDFRRARDEYANGKKLCMALGDVRCEAEAANNVGLSALKLGDVEAALSEFEIAGGAWERVHSPFGEAVTRSNLGLLYWQTGEWQQALRQYERSRQLFNGLNALSYARVLNNIGLVYMSMSEFDKAVSYFSEAGLLKPTDKTSHRDAGRFELNLGRAHMLAGRLGTALHHEQSALAKLKAVEDASGVADVYNNIGQVYLKMNQTASAKSFLETALSRYQDLGNQRGIASCQHHLGIVAARSRDLVHAKSLFEKALEIRSGRRLRDEAAETLYRLAMVEREEHEFAEADRHIEEAISLAESLGRHVESESLRRAYLADKHVYSDFLIRSLMARRTESDSGRLEAQAFLAVERSRARSLIDGMNSDRSSKDALDPELVSQQRSIRRKLNYKSVQLAGYSQNRSDAAAESAIRREVDALLAEGARIEALLRNEDPKYRPFDEPVLGIDEIQRELLGEKDVLVEYFLDEPRSYVWIVSRHSSFVKELMSKSTIERRAHGVIDSFENVRGRKADVRTNTEFQSALNKLAAAVGLPSAPGQEDKRFLIIPDGILHKVPFAGLPTGGITSADGSPAESLGMRFEIVQAPSATVFKLLRERKKLNPNPASQVTAFVDPVFDLTDSRALREAGAGRAGVVGKDSRTLELPRLPFSQIETGAIEDVVPPEQRTIRSGFDATREAFLDPKTWRSSIVLASTHAFADDLQPELSSIVLSMIARDSRPTDGFVRLYDIYDLNVLSSIVVLSGCETAQGRQVRGEGLVGISRGFLFAGASALVAPLNRVDAEASAALVSEFLKGVLGPKKMTPSRALLQARRIVYQSPRWRDPYYWSSFVLISASD